MNFDYFDYNDCWKKDVIAEENDHFKDELKNALKKEAYEIAFF